MTDKINLADLRVEAEDDIARKLPVELSADVLLALVDTAEAAIEFVYNANIATVQKVDGYLMKHGGTSTIHCHGDLIERLRESLDRYTTK